MRIFPDFFLITADNHRYMIVNFKKIFLLFLFTLISALVFSQDIKKSSKTEIINGKKFYLHEVEKKQTLYSIAKAYEVTVNDIVIVNPEAIEGINSGQILKIPSAKGSFEVNKNSISAVSDTLLHDTIILKDNYNVAMFLPFTLPQTGEIEPGKILKGHSKFPEKSKIAIEFYQGVMMAVDSMKKQKFNCTLYIYDTGVDSIAMIKLKKSSELKEMDLMIGPLYGNDFSAFSKIAKKENISIVSPMAQSNKVLLSNSNVSKVTPSAITQIEQMANYIGEKYAGQNIMILGNLGAKELNYVSTVKKTTNEVLKRKNISPSDTVKVVKGSAAITPLINPDKINLIIIPSKNESFVSNELSALYQLREKHKKDSIMVFGLEEWKMIESLDVNYLENLNVHFFSTVFADYENQVTKNFVSKYRKAYSTDPTHYVFDGFDITYYYLNALKKYGANFQSRLPDLKWSGIHKKFDFFQSAIESGYENRGGYILRLENYKLIEIK